VLVATLVLLLLIHLNLNLNKHQSDQTDWIQAHGHNAS